MEERDEAFEELIERSSLGAPGARQLRRRTSRSQVDAVRQIVDLRNRMFHGDGSEASRAAGALIRLFRELGYHGQAEHVLAEAFPGREADTVLRAAEAIAGTAGRDSEVKVVDLTDTAGRDSKVKNVDLTDEGLTSAASLWMSLREEPELREHVHRLEQSPRPDRAGRDRPEEVVVAVAATATAAAAAAVMASAGPVVVIVAAGSVVPVFARVLVEWLRSRRSDITVTVTGPGGRQVSLDAKRVGDPEHALREVLGDQGT